MTDKAQTIIDALAVGKLTHRQYAELQEMCWGLEESEQDAIDRWTNLGREIRGIRPKGPAETRLAEDGVIFPEFDPTRHVVDDQDLYGRLLAEEQERLSDRGRQLSQNAPPACADNPYSLDLPDDSEREIAWSIRVSITLAALTVALLIFWKVWHG